MKKIYILGTEADGMGRGEGEYYLMTEDGEFLASHLCSHAGYAQGDLHDRRQERKDEYTKRFGKYEVVWLGDDDMELETLRERNKELFKKDEEAKK